MLRYSGLQEGQTFVALHYRSPVLIRSSGHNQQTDTLRTQSKSQRACCLTRRYRIYYTILLDNRQSVFTQSQPSNPHDMISMLLLPLVSTATFGLIKFAIHTQILMDHQTWTSLPGKMRNEDALDGPSPSPSVPPASMCPSAVGQRIHPSNIGHACSCPQATDHREHEAIGKQLGFCSWGDAVRLALATPSPPLCPPLEPADPSLRQSSPSRVGAEARCARGVRFGGWQVAAAGDLSPIASEREAAGAGERPAGLRAGALHPLPAVDFTRSPSRHTSGWVGQHARCYDFSHTTVCVYPLSRSRLHLRGFGCYRSCLLDGQCESAPRDLSAPSAHGEGQLQSRGQAQKEASGTLLGQCAARATSARKGEPVTRPRATSH